jgi:hypothetical protein
VLTQVTTEDGYILSLQRIPVGRSGKNATKPPVLLHHGLFCVSFIAANTNYNIVLLYIQHDDLTPMIFFRML